MNQYVLLKRDLFDCPEHMGYTGIRDKAGVYLEWEVKAYEIPIRETYCPRDHDLYGLPLSEAPEFTRACFADLARDHLRGKIEEVRALAYARTDKGPILWKDIAFDAFDKAEQNRNLVKQAKLELGWKVSDFGEFIEPTEAA